MGQSSFFVTEDAVPTLQRAALDVGGVDATVLLAEPHMPLTTVVLEILALQEAAEPLPVPEQVHV